MVGALCARLKSYVRVAPPLHPGSLFFACPKKSDEKKGHPLVGVGFAGPLAPRSPPGARIRRIPAPDAHARDPSLAPEGPRFGFPWRSA